MQQESDTVIPAEATIAQAALALYEAPFRYERGYIWDAKSNMVADNQGQDVAMRVRGWGRIQYLPDASTLQDAVGALLAQAMTEYWNRENHKRDHARRLNAAMDDACFTCGSTTTKGAPVHPH